MKSEPLPQHEVVLKQVRQERKYEDERLAKLRAKVTEQLKTFEMKAA